MMSKWTKLGYVVAISITLAATFRVVYCGSKDKYTPQDPSVSFVETLEEGTQYNEESYQELPIEGNPDNLWNDATESEDDIDEGQESAILPLPSEEGSTLTKNNSRKGSLLLVSTLDGAISALDAENDGTRLWKIETGPGSLLSSSISKVELNSDGKSVRLIPSLDGGLYKFDGDGIEPIPISADSLLHSSFRAADDLIISGGKEIRTYGVDARTGRLQYLCTAGGCHVEPAEAGSSGEFLVIRRHSNIVRAIEPRTGTERWNFSVGRHEASLLHTEVESFANCKAKMGSSEDTMDCFFNKADGRKLPTEPLIDALKSESMEIKVVVPDGVICAVHPERTSNVIWKYKFDSPVVHVWKLIDGKLIPMDLFNADSIPALGEEQYHFNENEAHAVVSPLLYVGIHNSQLYVQESSRMVERVASSTLKPASSQVQHPSYIDTKGHRMPWKPFEVTSLISYEGRPGRFTLASASTTPSSDHVNESPTLEVVEKGEGPHITALIVRHEIDYPFDRGFYLFEEKVQKPTVKPVDSGEGATNSNEDEEFWEGGRDTPVHIVIVSLWFWWREVVFISLLTAFLFHMIITRQVVHLLQRRWAIELQRHLRAIVPSLTARAAVEDQQLEENKEEEKILLHLTSSSMVDEEEGKVESNGETPKHTTMHQSSGDIENNLGHSTVPTYVSRYLTDFEPIQCLGRGGFGLVFEVRNRLDDCHYAVKRIQLPNSEEAREKVMREVKALAKLDNPHIVRYFHAWIECPPPGWQETQDSAWIDSENLSGPTPYNSGEDSSVFQGNMISSSGNERDDPVFRISESFQSADMISRRRKFLTDDSSFDVVFEYSKTSKDNEKSQFSPMEEENDESSIGIHSDNAKKLISKCNFSGDGAKRHLSMHKPVQNKSPNVRQDAKMFLFIQMQLCRKESLREWLRAHVAHRDTYQVLHMFNEIIRAVEYVHLQGLIHRDLKPSNIFFAPDGAIKIGDFGLVTAMAEEAYFQGSMSPNGNQFGNSGLPFQRTHTDQVGTQMYMSPEQIEGKPYNYKVDIYSLGLILVELLWPLATQMEQVTVISQLRKLKLPPGFTNKYPEESVLLQKMLSRNPDERPTTYGIRASPPLISHQDSSILDIPEYLHFSLSRPRSSTRTSSTSSS